jgi:hypothetical protein
MCIQAIAKLLTGDIGGACKAEASAWGIGGAGGPAGFCGTKGAGGRAAGCYGESRSSHRCESGSRSQWGRRDAGYGNGNASFEKTTSQTRVGADGSVTHKTTHVSSSGGSGAEYGRSGYEHRSGYGRFDESSGARYSHAGFGAQEFSRSSFDRSSAWSHAGASSAGSASFAAASVSIAPFGLGRLFNLFGNNAQAA